MNETRSLDKTIDLAQVRKVLEAGKQQDINKGGYFDARSGCVNIWCGPDDKPECWEIEVRPGALNYPRAFCGTLRWDWDDEVRIPSKAKLYLECQPYELLEHLGRGVEPNWDSLFEWLNEKANSLLEEL